MALTDLPLSTLRTFRPNIAEPADFDDFWEMTLTDARSESSPFVLQPAETPISEIIVEDLTFAGFAGEPIRAWVTRPRTDQPRPAVVQFIGYGGGRGIPGDRIQWAAAGYVHVLMDTRGQGSVWGSGGDTPDPHGSDGAVPGFMTRGISSPETYYYRRLFTDGALLVDVVAGWDFVDAARIAVTGASQGGGAAIAVAALNPRVSAVMPDVPFLCHFERSIEMTPAAPFTEIATYLGHRRDQVHTVLRTLSYMDGANFAARITVPALFSVGLMDPVVLPSSVFAAFNRLASDDAEIEVYPYNAHEGGEMFHWLRQTSWLAARF